MKEDLQMFGNEYVRLLTIYNAVCYSLPLRMLTT